MDEIQTLVAHLGSRKIPRHGLAAAIKQLVAERQTLDGLRVELTVSGEESLSEPVRAGLFSIVQEALTNIAKHAGTEQAAIRLAFTADPIYVEIQDWGQGFDIVTSRSKPGHIGLAEMTERAGEIGWGLSINSQPGRGTRIRVEQRGDTA